MGTSDSSPAPGHDLPVWLERRLGCLVVEIVHEQPHHLERPVGATFRRRHHPGIARVQRVIVQVLQLLLSGRGWQLETPVVARDESVGQPVEPL